jgi:hypothetical protein
MAAERDGRLRAVRLRVDRAREPALRAAPFDQLAPGQAERGRGRGQRQRHSGALLQPRSREVGSARAPRSTAPAPSRHRALRRRAAHRPPRTAASRARQAQVQHAVLPAAWPTPAAAGRPIRLTRAARSASSSSKRSVASATGTRQHLERDLEHHAERAEAARHQARDVVAGDVLHHLAAEAQHLATAVEQLDAEHEVAHRARRARRGPDRPAATQPPTVAPGPKCGGSKASIWPLLRQRRLELGQRRAGAHGHDELGRLVGDDAARWRACRAARRGVQP